MASFGSGSFDSVAAKAGGLGGDPVGKVDGSGNLKARGDARRIRHLGDAAMSGGSPRPDGASLASASEWSRRAALRAGGMGLAALRTRPGSAARGAEPGPSVILVMMVGGASAAETFDPRPDAPAERRGPFGSIATRVPGVRLVEHLPRLAQRLNRLTLIRSLTHDADPTHADGLRMLASGSPDLLVPTLAARVAATLGAWGSVPPVVVLPHPVGFVGEAPQRDGTPSTPRAGDGPFVVGGVPGSPGFNPARLLGRLDRWAGRAAEWGVPGAGFGGAVPAGLANWDAASGRTRERFGRSDFGRSCWLAAGMVEAGARLVVIPMATTVFGQPSWDAHGRAPWSTWDDYTDRLLPDFDAGMTALIDHLDERGRLGTTLIVATGEMGRTPWINESGGRDHWPGAWSGLVAGGGTAGGRVVGATDDLGRIADRPTSLAELVALMARHLGLGPLDGGPDSSGLAALLT